MPLGPSSLVLERRLEILPSVENAFDQNSIRTHDKRDRDAPLERRRAQTLEQIVALLSSQGKGRKASAESHDTGDVIIGPTLIGAVRDVLIQAVDLAFGARG